MKPGKSRQPVALPKALLPDPDSLLLHIDRAVIATEYARASQDLSNIPPPLAAFNAHQKTAEGVSTDTDDGARNARRFLHGSLVEDYFHKVNLANTELSRSRRGSSKDLAFVPSGSELSNPELRSSGTKFPGASGKFRVFKSGSPEEADRRLDSHLDFPLHASSSQTPHTISATPFNPLPREIQSERPIAAKLPFFHPARSSLKSKAFSAPTNDISSEYDFYDREKSSSASSTCTGSPVERLRHGSPRMFTSALDLSSLLPGKLDLDDKVESPSELPVQYDALAADQAYRAGSAAMEDGDMVQAIALLRLALVKCPRNRPSALVKIEKLITAAAQQLEMQEASRNNDDIVHCVEQDPGVERHMPMKVLAVGDMLKADEAYRAGVASLEAGEPEKALEHLQTAILACPADRKNAATKIQALIDQANFELRMR